MRESAREKTSKKIENDQKNKDERFCNANEIRENN